MSETSAHDPLCHAYALTVNGGSHDPECCDCLLIASVVERERERINKKLTHLKTTVAALINDPEAWNGQEVASYILFLIREADLAAIYIKDVEDAN